MANNFEMNYETLANEVLEVAQKNNVILQHANMDYADQLFTDTAVGLKNNSVNIIVTLDQEPAELWTQGQNITLSDYNEASIKIVLDKVYDKSFTFNLMETTLNQGAVSRCAESLGRSHRDRYEIEMLKEAYSVATPLYLPMANGAVGPVDYAIMSKFAVDNNIASEDSVVFINSNFRAKMTAGTTIFQYSEKKEYKFTKGLDANTNFRSGNGFVTEESGLNFFLTDKLLPAKMAKYGLGWATPAAAPIAENEMTVVVSYVNYPFPLPDGSTGGIGLEITVNDSVATSIKAGTILRIGKGTVNAIEDSYIRLASDFDVPAGTGVAQTIILAGTSISGSLVNVPQGVPFVLEALSVSESTGYNAILCSNKAIAIAIKAPQITDANQAIAFDPITGMALRVWKEGEIKGKGWIISSDSIFVAKAVLPYQIAAVRA